MQNTNEVYFGDYTQSNNFLNNDYSYLRSSNRIQVQGAKKQELIREDRTNLKQNNKIEELMTCFICLSKLQSPHICPCCSKLCCHSCITKWLSEKQVCPHCRSVLRSHMLVNCRFLDDLGQALSQPVILDPCPDHPQQSLSYYCLTCSEPVCSECAMFATHKLHDFEHIQKVFDQRVREVSKEIEEVNQNVKVMKDNVRQVDDLVDQLNRGKDEKVQEIQQYSEQLLSKLEQSHQQRSMVLFQQKQTLTSKISNIHITKDDVQSKIQNLQKSDLIQQSDQLVKRVRALKEENTQVIQSGVNLEFQSEISPQYASSIFELKNFTLFNSEAIVYSPALQHNNIKWRLKLYPNGNGNARGVYISVFLEMGQTSQQCSPQRYEYKVEMVNQKNPNSCVVREFSSEFEGGECWGYNRFFRIDLLAKEGYLTEQDQTVIFKFYVRAPTYFYECQDMQKYIKHLEQKVSICGLQSEDNTQVKDQSYASAQEPETDQKLSQSDDRRVDDEDRSSIQKLKQEIEHYAEKIEELEQQSDSSNQIQLNSGESSECYDFETEEIDFQQSLITGQVKQEQPIRRNLINKFELEAKGQYENNLNSIMIQKLIEVKRNKQASISSHSSISSSAYENNLSKEFLDKLDQFKQYSNIIQKVNRRAGEVLSEINNEES